MWVGFTVVLQVNFDHKKGISFCIANPLISYGAGGRNGILSQYPTTGRFPSFSKTYKSSSYKNQFEKPWVVLDYFRLPPQLPIPGHPGHLVSRDRSGAG